MMLFLVLLATVIFLSLGLFFQRQIYRKNCLKDFLGPPVSSFWLGHAGEFNPNELLEGLFEQIKKHGNVFCLRIFHMYALIIADNKFCGHVLSASKNLSKSVLYQYTEGWLGQGLLTVHEKEWSARRKMLMPAFHYKILENFIPLYNKATDVLVEKIKLLKENENVDLFNLIRLCTLDIICETAMGVSINSQNNEDSEYFQCIKSQCDIFVRRLLSSMKRFSFTYIFTSDYWKERKNIKTLHDLTYKVIAQRKAKRLEEKDRIKNQTNNGKKAFLDMLLDYSENDKCLTEKEIRQEIDTFMFAGHDTSTVAISFCLYELANNPDVQEIAYEELNTIFEGDPRRNVLPGDLSEMKYLEAVIKEALRLYPPVPFYSRIVEHEFIYEGKTVPQGTNLGIFPYALHRDENLFENPLKFNPNRFLDGTELKPFSYLPFSAGPRNCIGNKIAMQEIKVILSKIIRNFEILPTDPPHQVKPQAKVVLHSKNGIYVRFKQRK